MPEVPRALCGAVRDAVRPLDLPRLCELLAGGADTPRQMPGVRGRARVARQQQQLWWRRLPGQQATVDIAGEEAVRGVSQRDGGELQVDAWRDQANDHQPGRDDEPLGGEDTRALRVRAQRRANRHREHDRLRQQAARSVHARDRRVREELPAQLGQAGERDGRARPAHQARDRSLCRRLDQVPAPLPHRQQRGERGARQGQVDQGRARDAGVQLQVSDIQQEAHALRREQADAAGRLAARQVESGLDRGALLHPVQRDERVQHGEELLADRTLQLLSRLSAAQLQVRRLLSLPGRRHLPQRLHQVQLVLAARGLHRLHRERQAHRRRRVHVVSARRGDTLLHSRVEQQGARQVVQSGRLVLGKEVDGQRVHLLRHERDARVRRRDGLRQHVRQEHGAGQAGGVCGARRAHGGHQRDALPHGRRAHRLRHESVRSRGEQDVQARARHVRPLLGQVLDLLRRGQQAPHLARRKWQQSRGMLDELSARCGHLAHRQIQRLAHIRRLQQTQTLLSLNHRHHYHHHHFFCLIFLIFSIQIF